jgi:hypothetical protein
MRDGEAHRDTRKPTERPQPRHAAARAEAFDMRESLSGKFLERGVQRVVHAPSLHEMRRRPSPTPPKEKPRSGGVSSNRGQYDPEIESASCCGLRLPQ